ncbi:MAG: LPS export ABC transporter periplasmic protein LptC [Deltaproteobacteria bacterium]|nr:LPS export ABC transporter periplasmic protein LptC [Deltaproteobacteria bacterium]
MMSGLRNLLWLLPLLALAATPLWKPLVTEFLAPHDFLKVTASDAAPDKSILLTGVQLMRYENGLPSMRLDSDRVRSGRAGMDTFLLQGVDVLLFDKGKEQAHIAGGEGFYDVEKGILTLADEVVVGISNRFELRAEALRYLIPYKTLKTATPVSFTSKNGSVSGVGMRYNLDSGEYRVGGPVVCDVQ